MNDATNLRDTIVPKSDQLNADDLIAGPITVRIVGVRRGTSKEQPVVIDIDGGHRPYKPCLSMRRVMITAWGENGMSWVGESMTLYCDPTVKFGGIVMGGIRISHMSRLPEPLNMLLTTTKARRSNYRVDPIVTSRLQISPANKALWERAKDSYRKTGSLSEVKKHAEISAELERQIIDEISMEQQSEEPEGFEYPVAEGS